MALIRLLAAWVFMAEGIQKFIYAEAEDPESFRNSSCSRATVSRSSVLRESGRRRRAVRQCTVISCITRSTGTNFK